MHAHMNTHIRKGADQPTPKKRLSSKRVRDKEEEEEDPDKAEEDPDKAEKNGGEKAEGEPDKAEVAEEAGDAKNADRSAENAQQEKMAPDLNDNIISMSNCSILIMIITML